MAADRRPPGSSDASRRALARVDGPRGQRDGRATVEARRDHRRRLRRVGIAAAVVLLLVGVGLVAGSPWRSYREQQAEGRTVDATLAAIEAERAEVEAKHDLLTTEAEIERKAREELGLVRPGEEAFAVVPEPVDPAGLPAVWPFTGVEQALGNG
jgi:cell division protein FtsB